MMPTKRVSVNVGIGSSFASSVHTDRPIATPLPWAHAGAPVYVQSGRQALRLLSELLWEDGYRRLILPGYLCASMIEPFETRAWTIDFSPLRDRLRPDPRSYDELCLERPGETVALVAEYFGRSLSERMQAAVQRWMKVGVAVIEDRTHNLLDERQPIATHTFGSLRKLLPLGDGCFIQGVSSTPNLVQPDVDPSGASWAAMDLRAAGDQADPAAVRQLYLAAEADFEVAMAAAPISSRSLHELSHLDIPAMSAARKANFGTLRELTQDMTVLNDDCADGTPAFLVLDVAHPKAWQQQLADRGVFCPIHWPRPQQVPEQLPWRSGLISVPIDHRYGHGDMERVARAITEVASGHD